MKVYLVWGVISCANLEYNDVYDTESVLLKIFNDELSANVYKENHDEVLKDLNEKWGTPILDDPYSEFDIDDDISIEEWEVF